MSESIQITRFTRPMGHVTLFDYIPPEDNAELCMYARDQIISCESIPKTGETVFYSRKESWDVDDEYIEICKEDKDFDATIAKLIRKVHAV